MANHVTWLVTWQAPGESTNEWRSVQSVAPDRFQSVSAPPGGIGRAFRAEVRNDDLVKDGWRAEGVGPEESASDRVVSYEWATWFPPDYPVDDPGAGHIWQVITQWHQQDGAESTGTSPPIAFIVHGEDIRLHLHRVDPSNLGTSLEVGQYPVATVDRETWHRFRMEVRWALKGGSIKLWHGGNLVPLPLPGDLQTLFPLRSQLQVAGTTYFKMGLYRDRVTTPPTVPPFVIYHDEIRRAEAEPTTEVLGKQLAAAANEDCRLEVFVTAQNDAIYHNWQVTPGGGWSGEYLLGEPTNAAKAITVDQNHDGRLEVFYIGTDYRLYHNWQMTAGGGWSGGRPASRWSSVASSRWVSISRSRSSSSALRQRQKRRSRMRVRAY
jgi:hypothetical protein